MHINEVLRTTEAKRQTRRLIGLCESVLFFLAVIIELPCSLLAQTVQIAPPALEMETTQWSNPPSQTLTITSDAAGGASCFYWVAVDQPWLSITPSTGTVDRQGRALNVRYSAANLDPGTYSAQITIVAPSATNSPQVVPVTLTVSEVDPSDTSSVIRPAPNISGMCGYQVTVPILMAASGSENAVGLSMVYNKSVFTSPRIALGADADALGGSIVTNMTQAANGVIGLALALPVGIVFPANSACEVATITFNVDSKAVPGTYGFAFTNAPIIRQIVGADTHSLPTKWLPGNVNVLAGYEGSLFPRPNGTNDGTYSVEDVVQMGRFISGLEKPSTAAEFQRADCAPITMGDSQVPVFGDGVLSVADWVQAARFAAGIDAAVIAGGPASNLTAYVMSAAPSPLRSVVTAIAPAETAPMLATAKPASPRTLALTAPKVCYTGAVNSYEVRLKSATGVENAATFSVSFDPTVQSYRGTRISPGHNGGLLVVNDRMVASGKLGFVVALPSGASFGTGERPLIEIDFFLKPTLKRSAACLSFTNIPAHLGVASTTATPLASVWQDVGNVAIAIAPPNLLITGFTDGQIVRTNCIPLSGTASDSGRGESGIVSVRINGARANDDTCVGAETAYWSKTVKLLEGPNAIRVVATDGQGQSATNAFCIIYDTLAPKVAIVSPSANARLNSGKIILKGTAKDSGKTSGVWYQLNGGSWAAASTTNGWTNWSANLNLQYGANLANVYAADSVGNKSRLQSVSFTYVATGRVCVATNGFGKIGRNFTGDVLEFGKNYRLEAAPRSKGWMFYNWTGNTTSFAPVLDFKMTPNAAYVANFVTNAYLAYKGEYDGLFYESAGMRTESSGFFRLNVSDQGSFSGQLRMAGFSPAFSGHFDGTGSATVSLQRPGRTPLLLTWNVSLEGVSGTLAASNWTATATGYKAASVATASRYTFAVPSAETDGYGTASMDRAGNTIFFGNLRDGTPFSTSSKLVQGARWPFYVSLANGQGTILSWITEGSDNKLTRLKPAHGEDAALTNEVTLLWSPYFSPSKAYPLAIDLAEGVATWSGGNLPQTIVKPFTMSANNHIEVTDAKAATMAINPLTGIIQGVLWHPGLNKPIPFAGVVLQDENIVRGFFFGTNQSGSFSLEQK